MMMHLATVEAYLSFGIINGWFYKAPIRFVWRTPDFPLMLVDRVFSSPGIANVDFVE
jgi:hypothetical protein